MNAVSVSSISDVETLNWSAIRGRPDRYMSVENGEIDVASANAATITALQAEIEDGKKEAARLAAEMLASAGQPAPVSSGGAGDNAPTRHLNTLATLKGSERTEYFKANEAAIRAELAQPTTTN